MMKKKTTRKNLSENRNNSNSISSDYYSTFNTSKCNNKCNI